MDTGIRTLAEQDINTLSTSKQTQLGAVGQTADGRKFRYVSFGGTSTIAPGLVVTAPALTANYQGLALTATATSGGNTVAQLATGSSSLVVTLAGTAVTQDQFAEGYIDVIVGGASADAGHYTYKVRGNTAQTSTTGLVTVYLAEPTRHTTALVPGTDTANLRASDYAAVNTSTTAALPIGLTVMPVPNTSSVTNYGWVQTYGDCVVLNDAGATITVGGAFGQSVTTAGNVVTATASTHPIIGITKIAISASTAGPAFLTLN